MQSYFILIHLGSINNVSISSSPSPCSFELLTVRRKHAACREEDTHILLKSDTGNTNEIEQLTGFIEENEEIY